MSLLLPQLLVQTCTGKALEQHDVYPTTTGYVATLHHCGLTTQPPMLCNHCIRYGQPLSTVQLMQEYLAGGAVNRVVAADMIKSPWQRHAYTLPDSLRWATQLAEALVYLHTQDPKVIHRDLKLSNILLTSECLFEVVGALASSKEGLSYMK
eukprot:GHUV01047866.1.p1 GENE.GHUV01047866.1~~GHUV01047866.1.p1  ORF type:complete len:152 (-),score=26.64 GHUV01047866.1:50-505(-)